MNLVRRAFNRIAGAAVLSSLCGAHARAAAQAPRWRMPDEADAHRRTWMAFGASEPIWGGQLLRTVRDNLGLIACRRRSKSEPPRRLNIEPGVEADFEMVSCG